MEIDLTPSEMMIAATVGIMRQIHNLNKGRVPNYGIKDQHQWGAHIEGCMGEYVVAKALGMYWSGNMGKLSMADVGDLQVRTGASHNFRLILHPKDNDQDYFILVTGVNGQYVIQGWCTGEDGKKPEYWQDPSKANRPAYFVPKSVLRPIEELKQSMERTLACQMNESFV